MGKKDDQQLADLVRDLIQNVGEDRDRLSKFLDELLSEYEGQSAGIAEYVSKIADSLTKQVAVKAGVIKALAKNLDVEADGDEDYSSDIGPAFHVEEDLDEGSN